jgi:hypothetical protein
VQKWLSNFTDQVGQPDPSEPLPDAVLNLGEDRLEDPDHPGADRAVGVRRVGIEREDRRGPHRLVDVEQRDLLRRPPELDPPPFSLTADDDPGPGELRHDPTDDDRIGVDAIGQHLAGDRAVLSDQPLRSVLRHVSQGRQNVGRNREPAVSRHTVTSLVMLIRHCQGDLSGLPSGSGSLGACKFHLPELKLIFMIERLWERAGAGCQVPGVGLFQDVLNDWADTGVRPYARNSFSFNWTLRLFLNS